MNPNYDYIKELLEEPAVYWPGFKHDPFTHEFAKRLTDAIGAMREPYRGGMPYVLAATEACRFWMIQNRLQLGSSSVGYRWNAAVEAFLAEDRHLAIQRGLETYALLTNEDVSTELAINDRVFGIKHPGPQSPE